MIDYELAHLINRITGLIAAFFAAGLALGYARVLDDESPLVRAIAWSIMLLTATAVMECLRVVHSEHVSTHLVAIFYNCTVLIAVVRGLQAQFRMIPEEDRHEWHWYSAPLYPPWAWVTGLDRFVSRVRLRNWYRSPTTHERRKVKKPIDFPDRRRNK